MKYPQGNKTYTKPIIYANRGMDLENEINIANKYYIKNDIAIIYKKPTPIGIVNVKNNDNNKIITKAFFKESSTLDYNGIYKGRYIEFDAKETNNKTSFPLSNIKKHQIEHIRKVIKHNGICFLIIKINNKIFLLKGETLIEFIEKENRKSLPYIYIEKNAFEITENKYIKINYIKYIDNNWRL